MRAQTRTNRHLGLNAGRERRTATANRDAISEQRRAEVFRQDVEHTGNAGDPTRPDRCAQPDGKLIAAEPTILAMRAAGMTYQEMTKATGLHQNKIRKILVYNGMIRRIGARLKY